MTARGRTTTYRKAALVLAAGVLLSPVAPAAAATQPFGQPVSVGDAKQVLTVASSGSYAKLTGWSLRQGTWVRTYGPVQARVGANGTTSSPREGRSATPRGTFTLTEAFGIQPRPAGTRFPYRRVWNNSWWVSDPASRHYNTWQVGPPNGRWDPARGEQLKRYGTAYQYALVIDFNRDPVVKGKGSAIFLHVGTGGPTAGCVSVSKAQMLKLLRYLNPVNKPRIAIR